MAEQDTTRRRKSPGDFLAEARQLRDRAARIDADLRAGDLSAESTEYFRGLAKALRGEASRLEEEAAEARRAMYWRADAALKEQPKPDRIWTPRGPAVSSSRRTNRRSLGLEGW